MLGSPIISTRAIVEHGPEVLLLRRVSTGEFAGCWEVPGGKMEREDNNDICAAAIREVAEETGLAVEWPEFNPMRLSSNDRIIPDGKHKGRPYRAFGVLVTAQSTDIILDPEEHDDAAWVRPHAALEMNNLSIVSRSALLVLGPLLLDATNMPRLQNH